MRIQFAIMFYFAKLYSDKSKKKSLRKTFIFIQQVYDYIQVCSRGLLSFIKKDAWFWECIAKKTILVHNCGFLYLYFYLCILLPRCTTLIANEHDVYTFKSSIYVEINISRKRAHYFDPKKNNISSQVHNVSLKMLQFT